MEKTKKPKNYSPIKVMSDRDNVKTEKTVTDQNSGAQQLYEDHKRKPTDQNKPTAIDPKKVRQNSHKKINKLLLKGRKRIKTDN